MKRVSTRFLLSTSAAALTFVGASLAVVSAVAQKRTSSDHRANELTLAGLRPGESSIARARVIFKKLEASGDPDVWSVRFPCFSQVLTITEEQGKVQTIRVSEDGKSTGVTCSYRGGRVPPNPGMTGRGLAVGEACARAESIYGKPTSTSPSTKDGKPLELLYYAFDWAGPDVPQVMEVVCSAPSQKEPSRVVEITLAAPSL